MGKTNAFSVQKKKQKRAKSAFLLLMTAQTFLNKAWISALEDKLSGAEVFTVVLEEQGKNFETALSKALHDGYRDISIFRFGQIPGTFMRKIPGILEMSRRTCLEADFNYGVGAVGETLKKSEVKKSRFSPRK